MYPHQSNFKHQVNTEKLAYWYLRLNGFLTTINFIVHPDFGRRQRTDVDIFGCRFPYRKELLFNPMIDDDIFIEIRDRIHIVIVEVKKGTCRFNGPWTNRNKKNMERFLKAIGSFRDIEVDKAAKYLYEKGLYQNEHTRVSLMSIGSSKNEELSRTYPNAIQVTWDKVLSFIYSRFNDYSEQKSSHPQWDVTGKLLWNVVFECNNSTEYINKIRISDTDQ